ncbi:MAG: lipopolysaccharide biosynthesis protein [Candidatus Dormibacteria bacterium]
MLLSSARRAALKRRNPLPEGTLSVGVGLLLAGFCAYGFLSVAARALGRQNYAPLATFWGLLFVCGPGFFFPLEQEVGRALAARRARHEGGGPLVRRAAIAGGALTVLLIVAATALAHPLTDRLFNGNGFLLAALLLGLAAYFAEHLARGMLSGNGRFKPYSLLLGIEGVFRILPCAILALIGVRSPDLYGFVLVTASFAAVAVALRGQRGLAAPGRQAPWTELTSALGYLLIASVLTQLFLNVGPIAVQLLATPQERASGAAGLFLNGLVIARVPLYLFQAVQASLLPKLAGLASQDRHHDFRHTLSRIVGFVTGLGGLATAGAAVLGPFAVRLLFGPGYDLGHADMAYLAGASGCLMIALCLTQALISLHGYARAAVGWTAGCAGFVVFTAIGTELFARVEHGLLGGSVVGIVVMAVLLIPLLRDRVTPGSPVIPQAPNPAGPAEVRTPG